MPSRNQRSERPARPARISRRQASEARAQLAAGGLSHQERRRLHSVTRTWDAASRHRILKFRHISIVVAGAVAAMAVVAVSTGLASALDAARGHGTAGTFVVGYQSCSRRIGCTWVGTFQPSGGGTVPGTSYDGSLPASAGPGSSIPALMPTGSDYVYPPRGSFRWAGDVLLTVIVGGAVGFGLWISPLGLRRQASP